MKKSSRRRSQTRNSGKVVRYAVVGLGHIAQVAVLPGFAHARKSELTALVSGDPKKLKKLAKKYGVTNTYGYEQYDECLRSGLIDAVYIALPNDLHREYTVRAAKAGIHVLCEKPLATTVADAERVVEAAERTGTLFAMGFCHRFQPHIEHLKAMIERARERGA